MNSQGNYTRQDLLKMSKEELVQTAISLRDQVIAAEALVKYYEEQYRLRMQQRFGSKSEKGIEGQLSLGDYMPLFNEAEALRDPINIEPKPEDISSEKPKKKAHGKKRETGSLDEVVEDPILLPDDEQVCPKCGGHLHEIRTEDKTYIEIIPAKAILHKYPVMVYGCRNCEKDGSSYIVKADGAPRPLIKGSMTSASLMADLFDKKFVNANPFYRIEQDYKRKGIPVTRNNMCNWTIRIAIDWLEPLFDRLRELLLQRDVIHCDETEVEVLSEPHRPSTCNSYVWVTASAKCDSDAPIALYFYTETRASYQAREILKGYKGFIHCDGYAGYDALTKDGKNGPAMEVTLIACLVHIRRKFKEALRAVEDQQDYRYTSAQKGLELIGNIFDTDALFDNLSPEDRYEQRLVRLKPKLDDFFEWAESEQKKVLPKCQYGTAINYAIKQKDKVFNVLLDGRLELDNNLAERTVKPFVIGRKNWLFSNTPAGATASCIVYSLAQTAMINGLKPYEYFKYILEQLPEMESLCDLDELDKLLPWSESIPEYCKSPVKD